MRAKEETLVVEELEFKVVRKVVKVTHENLEDGSLSAFMEKQGLRCKGSWGGYIVDDGIFNGVTFYDLDNYTGEHHVAYFGDYIAVNGHKDASVLTEAELTASGAAPV